MASPRAAATPWGRSSPVFIRSITDRENHQLPKRNYQFEKRKKDLEKKAKKEEKKQRKLDRAKGIPEENPDPSPDEPEGMPLE